MPDSVPVSQIDIIHGNNQLFIIITDQLQIAELPLYHSVAWKKIGNLNVFAFTTFLSNKMNGFIPQGQSPGPGVAQATSRKFAFVATFLGFACDTLLMRTRCFRSYLGSYRSVARNEQGCMGEQQAMLATSPRHSLGNHNAFKYD